jgi:hypothetical protein
MIIQLFTKNDKLYRLSNFKEDNGCPYIIGEQYLNIFLTNPHNLYYNYNDDELQIPHIEDGKVSYVYLANPQYFLFNYKNDAIILPYHNITTIKFRDKPGEDLYRFVWAKNHNGEEPPEPPFYPAHPDEPDLIGPYRDKRVIGHAVFSGTAFSDVFFG